MSIAAAYTSHTSHFTLVTLHTSHLPHGTVGPTRKHRKAGGGGGGYYDGNGLHRRGFVCFVHFAVFEHGVVGKRLEAVPFVAVPHVTDPVAAASDHRLSVRAVRGAHGFAGHSSLPAAASGTVVVPGIAAFEVRWLR